MKNKSNPIKALKEKVKTLQLEEPEYEIVIKLDGDGKEENKIYCKGKCGTYEAEGYGPSWRVAKENAAHFLIKKINDNTVYKSPQVVLRELAIREKLKLPTFQFKKPKIIKDKSSYTVYTCSVQFGKYTTTGTGLSKQKCQDDGCQKILSMKYPNHGKVFSNTTSTDNKVEFQNHIGDLQDLTRKMGKPKPVYKLVSSNKNIPHEPQHTVKWSVDEDFAEYTASNIKTARQLAALKLINILTGNSSLPKQMHAVELNSSSSANEVVDELQTTSTFENTSSDPIYHQPSVLNPTILKSIDNIIPTGLNNCYGVTCYINSLIQSLFSLDIFVSKVFNTDSSSNEMFIKMKDLFKILQKKEYREFKPKQLVDEYIKTLPKPEKYQQQDSSEYLFYLLEKLGETNMKNHIEDIFGGTTLTTRYCSQCHNPSMATDPIQTVQIPLKCKEYSSISTLFDTLLVQEELTKENKFTCSKCNEKHDEIIRESFKSFQILKFTSVPQILIIILKIFEFNNLTKVRSKINLKMKWNSLLKLNVPMQNGDKNCIVRYDLNAAIHHGGSSVNSGHYTTFAFHSRTNKWYNFNDNHVSVASADPSGTPYILFYKCSNNKFVKIRNENEKQNEKENENEQEQEEKFQMDFMYDKEDDKTNEPKRKVNNEKEEQIEEEKKEENIKISFEVEVTHTIMNDNNATDSYSYTCSINDQVSISSDSEGIVLKCNFHKAMIVVESGKLFLLNETHNIINVNKEFNLEFNNKTILRNGDCIYFDGNNVGGIQYEIISIKY